MSDKIDSLRLEILRIVGCTYPELELSTCSDLISKNAHIDIQTSNMTPDQRPAVFWGGFFAQYLLKCGAVLQPAQ